MAFVINIAQTAIYADLTAFDITDNLLQVVCTICGLLIVVIAIRRYIADKSRAQTRTLSRKIFTDMSWIDIVALVINFAAVGVWLRLESPEWGSVVMGVADIASFVPILISTRRNPDHERAVPWLWWTMAYGLLTWATIVDRDYWESIFPGMNLLLHLAIALYVFRGFVLRKNNI